MGNIFLPMSLLDPSRKNHSNTADHLRASVQRIQDVLRNSYIDAYITNVCVAPISVRYELELSPGVRLAAIQGCASDIALALGCEKVTIAPVVGKYSVVGIDVPKTAVETVCLRDVLDTPELREDKSPLAFALGQDIAGNNVICDIGKERHLLIGGATGTGKSTLLHSLIISLLYHASPENVRLVIVDTTGLELRQYIVPHLLIPPVTNERKAVGAIQWLNSEVQQRYNSFSKSRTRSIYDYNRKAAENGAETLPHIVAIVDDIFHLFAVRDDSLEGTLRNLILRGHIVGVHLILATQHAYTGAVVNLANLRNMGRIAFALSSRLDSIALLGKDGAEKLSGKGELLYLPIGSSVSQHIQGCFVSDSEIESVINCAKIIFESNSTPSNQSSIETCLQMPSKETPCVGVSNNETDGDELFPAAVDAVLETGLASVSMLQRRLKLGYNRAAQLVDEMEKKGIVGSFQGTHPRSILITHEQWAQMKRR